MEWHFEETFLDKKFVRMTQRIPFGSYWLTLPLKLTYGLILWMKKTFLKCLETAALSVRQKSPFAHLGAFKIQFLNTFWLNFSNFYFPTSISIGISVFAKRDPLKFVLNPSTSFGNVLTQPFRTPNRKKTEMIIRTLTVPSIDTIEAFERKITWLWWFVQLMDH